MDITDACRRLKVTPILLKWFARNAAKDDSRRLIPSRGGTFRDQALTDFEAYLWAPWPSSHVPLGVEAELTLESQGRCGRCDAPCLHPSYVQVGRDGLALGYACQHPHNLIPLCAGCRARYDAAPDKERPTLVEAKARLLERHMLGVAHDFATASAIDAAVSEAQHSYAEQVTRDTGFTPSTYQVWKTNPQALIRAATLAAERPLQTSLDGLEARVALQHLRDAFGTPTGRFGMTRAVLLTYIRHTTPGSPPGAFRWQHIEPEDHCARCTAGPDDAPKIVNYYRIGNDQYAPGTEIARCHCHLIRCGKCRGVTEVLERQLDKTLDCQGGCGMRFRIDTEPSQRGGYENPIARVLPSDTADAGR